MRSCVRHTVHDLYTSLFPTHNRLVLCFVEFLARLESAAVSSLELSHLLNQVISTEAVHETERASKEWWEPETEHESDVSLRWVAEDALLEAHHGLVHETAEQAHTDVLLCVLDLCGYMVLL